MSMQKRALPSSSSGQPSQPKRPCFPPTEEGSNGRSWLTKEDLRTVIREELQRAKSDFVEYCQSFVRSAVEEIVQEMHSMKNDSKKLKEAVEPANIHAFHLGRANAKSTAKNDARNLQLQLQTKLSLPLFTGKKLEGQGGAHIHVALIDTKTGGVVKSGPESSIKLDVVVLEGDFNKDDEENWTPEEFENYVVKERKGKRPLVMGNLQVTLKGGVGEMGELIFTDNSSWNRSGRFRIGLKVASGFCGNKRIREAITDAFPVKEHRGEAYRKHHPPASDDEVWRLEKIAKDGPSHHKLSKAGICTVEDFLLQLFMDPVKLRKILGKSITQNKWDSLICHAKTCKTKWKLYWDYPDGVTKHGAVFNTDGQPIGLVKDGEYFATRRLSAQEKDHGDTIVKKALANWNDVKEFSGETFSDSMQKNGSSSFSSQVFGGQIENFNPVPSYLAPPIFAAPVGPEAPLANVGSTADGLNGSMALTLPVQLQNTNSGNFMEISVDEYFPLAAHQPISADHLNVPIPPGYHGSTFAEWPTQSHGINLQKAMPSQMIDSSSQMDYTGYDNVLPKGHHEMEDFQSIDLNDLVKWFPDSPPCDDPISNIPLFDNGFARGTSRGVIGWLKIKAVLQWGFFIRKRGGRGVRLVQLDEPPIAVRACS